MNWQVGNMEKKTVFFCLLSCCILVDGQQWNPQIEQEIIGFIENLMNCRQIPGLSVVIAQKDQILMQKGFGLADTDNVVPATEDTLFCIGSTTKAFTASLVGSVLAEYNTTYPASFDTKLVDIFGPEFKLIDPYRTDLTTVKDALAHRTGLSFYPGAVTVRMDTSHSRLEYCSRFFYFEPAYEFRNDFLYNNWMFTLASCVAEAITGQGVEALMKERIFDVLGMTNTILTADIASPDQVASSYFINETDDVMRKMDPANMWIYPGDGSGGICSPATDMAKWLQFHLSDDKSAVLPNEYWQDTMTPQFVQYQPDVSKPQFPQTDDEPNYGMGWAVGTYRGYRKSSHKGSISGFETKVTVFHDLDLAIYTSGNGPMFSPEEHNVLHYHIADLVRSESTWLDNTTACTYPAPWVTPGESKTADNSYLHQPNDAWMEENNEPVRKEDWYTPFEGQYGHPFFGNITVFYDEASQQIRFTTGLLGVGFMENNPAFGEGWMEIHFEGALSYFHLVSPNFGFFPPIIFTNLVGNTTHGRYQEIFGLTYDPMSPPTFYRDFEWDDEYPPTP